MKITLVVLFLAGLTIYCKCAAVLSLPPSLIAHAASLDESLKTQKPLTAKDNELQPQLLAKQADDEEELYDPTLATDLYTNFENLWHNDLSLNLQKREDRNTFDDDIDNFAAIQQPQQQSQTMATIKKNNQNQNGLQLHDNDNDNDNVSHKNYNHVYNKNENENNIIKSLLPYTGMQSSAATNLYANTQSQLPTSLQKNEKSEKYGDINKWLSSTPEMIDDIFVSPAPQLQQQFLHLKRRELENMPPVTASAKDSPFLNRILKSKKYWSRECPLENENNCLQKYYSALIADRKKALLQQLQYKQRNSIFDVAATSADLDYNNNLNDDDIVLLLTAEQNLMQFLSWALAELYPYGKFSNVSANGADGYHPSMYIWKKLNLSGRLEPPLEAQEPRYVIMRREYDEDDSDEIERGLNYGTDPFIPPRGRKHDLPDLDSLLQRYETFVPNRGRRDKIKDIFKYDDLFYPNRGKRQMAIAATDNGDVDATSDDIDIEEIKVNQRYYNNEQNAERRQHEMQHPLLSNELMEYVENLMAKMKRKLLQPKQKLANNFDAMSHRNETSKGMSTTLQQAPPPAPLLLKKRLKSMINILHNQKKPQQQHLPNHYNARRQQQWWKRYTTQLATNTRRNYRPMAEIRSPTMATNRLQKTLKSMSPQKQQLQQVIQLYQQLQPNLSPPHLKPDNKFMRQQQQQQQNSLKSLAQQFDPLSWHKLQLLLQQQQQYHHSHNQPLLTMRHPRLTALQHLPALTQQLPQQQLQLATPQETQLSYSFDQFDNSITNDLDNLYNKNLD